MGIEIERKFLVTGSLWRLYVDSTTEMSQGYFTSADVIGSTGQKASIRIRVEDIRAFLNVKSCQSGHTRQEFEYPIGIMEALQMLDLCMGEVVRKKRHRVHFGNHVWEVDEFLGNNAGLVVAEVELQSADEDVILPTWVTQEVTDDLRYTNLALSTNPYINW